MVAIRLRWVAAQVGRKPGAQAQLAMCLDPADLAAIGGSWRQIDQRTWRTGLTGDTNPWAAAAKAAGSITAWRSYKARGYRAQRGLWIQIMPLARAEDGPAAMESLIRGDGNLRNLRAIVKVVATRELDPAPNLPGASLVSATEQDTHSVLGPGTALTLRFLVGADVVIMAASSLRKDGWTWPDLLLCADLQTRLLGRRED